MSSLNNTVIILLNKKNISTSKSKNDLGGLLKDVRIAHKTIGLHNYTQLKQQVA